jgi:hypothetical protein
MRYFFLLLLLLPLPDEDCFADSFAEADPLFEPDPEPEPKPEEADESFVDFLPSSARWPPRSAFVACCPDFAITTPWVPSALLHRGSASPMPGSTGIASRTGASVR